MEKFPYSKLVSSSQGEFIYDGEKITYFYNKLAPKETLWSDLNPCRRANEVIHEIRDSERKLAKENTRLKKHLMNCESVEMFESGSKSSNVEMSESGNMQNVDKNNQTKEVNHDVVDLIELNTKIKSLKQKCKSLKKE
ncbi:hypothetical protein PVK06_044042 [Gossypium arboreum]|uniref:Uncharacterized protein n=1 Tax=Gossypium arboreum TaxID=29729 RepID=A0ABR0MQ40_GOSAR|nr:hypothetical protein PVK06_044042 [Gossypium arboreum]